MTHPTKIGRYEILERVGRGGMGVLYRGRDTVLDREVAIKVMSTDFEADDDTARPRFYREARAAAKLQHRNIVTVFEFGEEEHTPFIVMEFLRGQDLSKRMRVEPPLTLEAKLDMIADLCTGLHFAHEQGVIHRDVKPANIWIQTDGSIKLLDFGIAKFASSTMTRQGSVFGSISYMAPEQVAGGEVDGRADVFSAGVVLYELLTGKKPFDGDSPTAVLARIMDDRPASVDQLGPDVPRPLAAALAKALQKDRDKRYRYAGDFGADLRLVRSALSAVDASTMDIEFTRAMSADGGTTLVTDAGHADPAGAVKLVEAHPPLSMPAAMPIVPRKWAIATGAGLLVLVLTASGFYFSRGAPREAEQAASGADRAAVSGQPAKEGASPTPAGAARQESPVAGIASQGRRAGMPPQPRTVPGTRSDVAPVSAVSEPPAPSPAAGVEIILTASYPFEVYAEGRLASSSAAEHRVRISGRQSLRLRAPEFFLDAPVVVDAGTRHVQAPELGRLKLRIPEICSATINGRNLGEPPYGELQIAAGSYRVQMACPDGNGRDVPITIRPGELREAFIAK